jgi:hypothetical protein
VRGERAGLDRMLHYLQEFGPTGMAKNVPGLVSKWKVFQAIAGSRQGYYSDYESLLLVVPGNVTRQRADVLRHVNKAVEIVKRPPEQWRSDLDAWQAQVKQSSYLPRMLTPMIANLADVAQRHHAQLRCAATAVAAERFRQQTGQWPATADELVKAGLLTAVLIDPYDGQPLRLKRPADGLVIYAVGPDLADNGGNLHPRTNPPGTDLGFRLWDVPARRQPPLPPKPEDGAGP